jgi:hypothetical protein
MLSTRDENTFRKPRKGYSFMMPQMLRSGIFAISAASAATSRAVPQYDDISDTTRGASVEYRGASLRQYDLRVLLGLLQRAGGMHADNAVIEFDANEFLESIGKSTGTRSVDVLQDSLASLRSATFVVRDYARDKGLVFGFVNSVEWTKRKCKVTLSPSACWKLTGLGWTTYVPMTFRNRLADGVQTALADVLFSSATASPETVYSVDLAALAALWGREVGELGREVRSALDRLQAVGIIQEWSATRGRVHVRRAVML